MRLWVILVFVGIVGTSNVVMADNLQLKNDIAHFGVSYAATHVLYTVNNKALGIDPWGSWFFSALIVNTAGALKEFFVDNRGSERDFWFNVGGSVACGMMIYTFEF